MLTVRLKAKGGRINACTGRLCALVLTIVLVGYAGGPRGAVLQH